MNKKNGYGLGFKFEFLGGLSIIFILLKLFKLISWSWLWVLCPLWIPIGLYYAMIFIYLIITCIISFFKIFFAFIKIKKKNIKNKKEIIYLVCCNQKPYIAFTTKTIAQKYCDDNNHDPFNILHWNMYEINFVEKVNNEVIKNEQK